MVEGKLRLLSQCSSAFLSAINGAISKLTTTSYYVQEENTDFEGPAVEIVPKSGDNSGALAIKPKGTTQASYLDIYNAEDTANAGVLDISIGSTKALITTNKTGTGSFVDIEVNAGGHPVTFAQADGSVSLPGALIFHGADVFLSNEITGSGSAQNTAHSLGRTPVIAIAYITDAVGSDTVSAVTSDGTNCTVTAHTGTKYRILAL